MKKISLLGSLGGNNYGDLLIAKSIESIFSSVNPEFHFTQVDILSRNSCSPFFKRTGSSLYGRLLKQISSPLFIEATAIKIYKQAKDCQLFVVGGGNLLNLALGCLYPEVIKLTLHLLREDGVPYGFFGTGFGYLPDDWIHASKNLFSNAQFFFTREFEQYQRLSTLVDLPSTSGAMPDPVFFLSAFNNTEILTSNKRRVGINLLNKKLLVRLGIDPDSYYDSFLNYLSRKKWNSKIIVTEKTDLKDSIHFANQLSVASDNSVSVLSVFSEAQMKNAYKDLDLFIGSRMHSQIIALAFNITTYGFEWDPKISSMYESLRQGMSSSFCSGNISKLFNLVDDDSSQIKYSESLPAIIQDASLQLISKASLALKTCSI